MNILLPGWFPGRLRSAHPPRVRHVLPVLAGALFFLLASAAAHAHGVADGDKGYIQEISGTHLLPFTYLGAKHMG